MPSKIIDLLLKIAAYSVIFPLLFLLAIIAAIWRRVRKFIKGDTPLRLVWAGVPLYSLIATSQALRDAGYDSISIANDRYPTTNPQDFDTVIKPSKRLPYGLNTIYASLRATYYFVIMMFTRDVLHGFFNGALLGKTPLIDAEYFLWKLSGGYLVLMSYGSDSFVYSQLPDRNWAGALRETYPRTPQQDKAVENRLTRFSQIADFVIGCIVHDLCLPRVDRYTVLWYPANLEFKEYPPKCGPVLKVAHASNHDGLKGSQSLLQAVRELKGEGVKIELDMLSQAPRALVLEAFISADVIVDQLLFGYALTALEAMSLGKPVISGISDDKIYEPFRRDSYLDNSPIIPASVNSIKGVLRNLADNKNMLPGLGRAGRQYVEEFHSPASSVRLFEAVYRKIHQ